MGRRQEASPEIESFFAMAKSCHRVRVVARSETVPASLHSCEDLARRSGRIVLAVGPPDLQIF
jgi:hypothetical protein